MDGFHILQIQLLSFVESNLLMTDPVNEPSILSISLLDVLNIRQHQNALCLEVLPKIGFELTSIGTLTLYLHCAPRTG